MNEPNKKLYIVLLLIFALIALASIAFVSIASKWFSIIAGVGSGGITSVVVAWLIDSATCKANSEKQKKIAKFVVNGLVVSISKYLETFCDICVDVDENLKVHHYTYEQWFDIYIEKLKAGEQIKKSWVVHAAEDVKQQYQTLNRNIFWLIDSGVLSIDDYRRIKLAAQRISCMYFYYGNKETEYSPEIYIEENESIVESLQLYKPFAMLLKTPFSSNALLSKTVDMIDEYALLI